MPKRGLCLALWANPVNPWPLKPTCENWSCGYGYI